MISQPGLSARLSELEAEVGVKLLERTSKGVSPTEEGARLLAHVEAVLGRYRLLQNDLPAIAQGRSTVRVGFRPYSGEAEMIQLCRDFQQCFPETRVVFNEMRNVTPSLFLDEDQFDFLATTMRLLPPDWQEKYGYCVLGEMEEVKLYCHAMNPLAKLGEIGLAELDRCPIAFWDGHREVLERLRAAGLCIEPCSHPAPVVRNRQSDLQRRRGGDAQRGLCGPYRHHTRLPPQAGALVRVPERRSHPALSGMEKILGAV